MYPIKTSFGKKCPTTVITDADSSSSSTTSNEVESKEQKQKKDESKYVLKEEEKENLNKGRLSLNNSPKYFRKFVKLINQSSFR